MSQTTRSKSEFLGLHDPFAETPANTPAPKREKQPLMTKESRSEMLRAATTMTVICLLIAVAISIIY